jgi:methionine-rich copper-binding protein CopC
MKQALILMAVMSLAASSLALGHAKLKRTEPADQSVMAVAPKQLLVVYDDPVTVTSLTIQKDDGKPQALVPLPKAAVEQLRYTLPALGPGTYLLKWRGVSDDQHLILGKLTFKVAKP